MSLAISMEKAGVPVRCVEYRCQASSHVAKWAKAVANAG